MYKNDRNSRTTVGGKKDSEATSKLETLEVVKNESLGMYVGTIGALTYFGSIDQQKWRQTYNPKRVFDKFMEVFGVPDLTAEAVEASKKKFNTYFQSVTAPIALNYKVVIKQAETVAVESQTVSTPDSCSVEQNKA